MSLQYGAAQTTFSECEALLQKGKTDKAISCYQSLLNQPKPARALTRLAELYYQEKDSLQVLYYANQALDRFPAEAFEPLYFLCNRMKQHQDTALALLILNRMSVSGLEEKNQKKASDMGRQFRAMKGQGSVPHYPLQLENMGDSINTSEHEYLPTLSLDGRTLVFTRRVDGNEDFYIAEKDSTGRWHKARNLGYPPNTSMPEGGAMLSADGHYLFYTRCDMPSPDGIIGGGCDLVFSYRADSVWSSPQYFGFTINTTGYEGQPCLSSDNRDLYFVSNREGGYGGMDIWVSHYEHNYWSKPVNLGPSVNTAGNETAPFIHADNETLYFASDGLPGVGQTDLFISRKNKDGSWKPALNLGTPINTPGFDGSIVVDAKGCNGYLASDRGDSKGGLDLYRVSLCPEIQPKSTLCVKGQVTDKFRGTLLTDRTLTFIRWPEREHVAELSSNEGDASYVQALPCGRSYLLRVTEEGYRPYYKIIALEKDTPLALLNYPIRLKQPGIKDTLFHGRFYFDEEAELDSTSQAWVDSIGKHWLQWTADSATVHIYVHGYYYSGDSLSDGTMSMHIHEAGARMQCLTDRLMEKQIPCEVIMDDLSMLIYDDDKSWYHLLEAEVVEHY